MSKTQTQSLVEDNFDVERLAEFWTFVHERQMIYVRRCIQKRPPPWTDDPVLRAAFFTNVYREQDKGTQYLMEHVIDHGSEVDECFEILVYRLFNNRRTYEAMRLGEREFGTFSREWAPFLREYGLEHGVTVFSEAHMTNSYSARTGMKDKLESICYMLDQHWQNRYEIFDFLMSSKSLKDLCKRIAELDGFGDFLAYEVATDHGYSPRLSRWSEDDWVSAGPGCRRGINLLLPRREELKIPYEDVISVLRYGQREFFDCLRINFQFAGKDLSLRNIEHSLCEYFKYHRAKHTGVIRRKYVCQNREKS